jgi:hypothetical protein
MQGMTCTSYVTEWLEIWRVMIDANSKSIITLIDGDYLPFQTLRSCRPIHGDPRDWRRTRLYPAHSSTSHNLLICCCPRQNAYLSCQLFNPQRSNVLNVKPIYTTSMSLIKPENHIFILLGLKLYLAHYLMSKEKMKIDSYMTLMINLLSKYLHPRRPRLCAQT